MFLFVNIYSIKDIRLLIGSFFDVYFDTKAKDIFGSDFMARTVKGYLDLTYDTKHYYEKEVEERPLWFALFDWWEKNKADYEKAPQKDSDDKE